MTTKRTVSVSDQIVEAFIELLKEKPFMNITVTELVNRAGVARASFYRNFDTTSDVMDYLVDEFISRLLKMAHPVIEEPCERNWRDFLFQCIYFLMDSEKHYLQIHTDNISLMLQRFSDKVREVKKNLRPKSMNEVYNMAAKMASISGILLSWRETGMQESVEDIVNYTMSIISKY